MGLRPLADRVVIKEIKDTSERSVGGIIVPGQQRRHKEGIVVAVGRGKMEPGRAIATNDVIPAAMHWNFTPMELAVGDKVLFTFGDAYEEDKDTFYVLHEHEISAVIE